MNKVFQTLKKKFHQKKQERKSSKTATQKGSDDQKAALKDTDRSRSDASLPSAGDAAFEQRLAAALDAKFHVGDFSRFEFPSFNESIPKQKELIFIQKCKLCCVCFSFSKNSPAEYVTARRLKTKLLAETCAHVLSASNWLTEKAVRAVSSLALCNIFQPATKPTDAPEDAMAPTSAHLDWEHRSWVYEIVLRTVNNFMLAQALSTVLVDTVFLRRLLSRIDCSDIGERRAALRVLHCVYARRSDLRPALRKYATDILDRFVYQREPFFGLRELLLLYTSFSSGFVSPLKEKHFAFVRQRLIPLFAEAKLVEFADPLQQCLEQLLEKAPGLAEDLLAGALRLTLPRREALAVNCMLMLEILLPVAVKSVISSRNEELALLAVECVSHELCSSHQLSADKALGMMNKKCLQELVQMNPKRMLPLLLRALENNKNHWNSFVREQSAANLSSLKGVSFLEFDKEGVDEGDQTEWITGAWKELEKTAASGEKTF